MYFEFVLFVVMSTGLVPAAGFRTEGACEAFKAQTVATDADGKTLRMVCRKVARASVRRFAGVDDGVADRVGAVKATGNGQVPAVAALAWRVLGETLGIESGV